MKLQKIVRMQIMLMGLGAALLLASSAYAQQDMDPTDFPINPSTPKAEVAAVQPAAQGVATTKAANAETVTPASLRSESTRESDAARVVGDAVISMFLIAAIASIAIYELAETKRTPPQPIPQDGPYNPGSGATTH